MFFYISRVNLFTSNFPPRPIPRTPHLEEGVTQVFPLLIPAPEKIRSFPHHKTTRDKRKTTFTTLLSSLFAGFSEVQRPSKKRGQINRTFFFRTRAKILHSMSAAPETEWISFLPLFPPLSSFPPVGTGTVRGHTEEGREGDGRMSHSGFGASRQRKGEKGREVGRSVVNAAAVSYSSASGHEGDPRTSTL